MNCCRGHIWSLLDCRRGIGHLFVLVQGCKGDWEVSGGRGLAHPTHALKRQAPGERSSTVTRQKFLAAFFFRAKNAKTGTFYRGHNFFSRS